MKASEIVETTKDLDLLQEALGIDYPVRDTLELVDALDNRLSISVEPFIKAFTEYKMGCLTPIRKLELQLQITRLVYSERIVALQLKHGEIR